MALRRRLAQTLKSETTFKVGVICVGFLPIALVLAVLFLR